MTDTEIVHIVHLRESNHESNVDDIKNEPQPRTANVALGLALVQRFLLVKIMPKKHLDMSTACKTSFPQLDSANRSRQK